MMMLEDVTRRCNIVARGTNEEINFPSMKSSISEENKREKALLAQW
jgi:hypothetical protein